MSRLLALSVFIAAPVAAATMAIAPRQVHPFLEWGVVDVEYMMVIEADDGRTSFRRLGDDQCLEKYQDGPVTCEELDFVFAPPLITEALIFAPLVGALPPGTSSPGGGGGGGGGGGDPWPPVDPWPPFDPIPPPIPLPATLWLFLVWIAAFFYLRKSSNG